MQMFSSAQKMLSQPGAWASSHMGRVRSRTASIQAGRASASIHFQSEVAHDGLNLFGRHSCMSALTSKLPGHVVDVSNDCKSWEPGCTFQEPVKGLGWQKPCRQRISGDAHDLCSGIRGLMLPYLAGCFAQGSQGKPWSHQTLAIASFLQSNSWLQCVLLCFNGRW